MAKKVDKDHILKTIMDILEEDFDCPREKLVPEARLFEDLDLDSIDAVDLIVRLQKIIKKKVSPENFQQIRTLDDIAEVINTIVNEEVDKP